MAQQIISVLERVKDANGNYVLILPVNTVEEVLISLDTGERLSDVLKKIIIIVKLKNILKMYLIHQRLKEE